MDTPERVTFEPELFAKVPPASVSLPEPAAEFPASIRLPAESFKPPEKVLPEPFMTRVPAPDFSIVADDIPVTVPDKVAVSFTPKENGVVLNPTRYRLELTVRLRV